MPVSTESPTKTLNNYIGGAWVDAPGAELHDVVNPANGETIARVPYSTGVQLDAAVGTLKNFTHDQGCDTDQLILRWGHSS